MNKVEGKVGEFCPKCKNCKGVTRESNGVHVWLTEVECEDPYDGMTKTLDADSDIRCSMFESKKEKESFNLNMPREAIKAIAKLNDVICELEKEKSDHLKGIERLKKKNDKYLKKIIDQQTTHYKQCARILDLENMVNKLQSGEYDDILAKDIEIKSLQDKYEAAMAGWKDAIDTNDKMIGEKDKQIEELTRRYNMIAKKLNDIHDILKEDPNNA